MQEFFSWFRSTEWAAERPWLILGKGPSLEKLDQFDRSQFNVLSLNHVVRAMPVDVAHAIDLDVLTACSETIGRNARYVMVPWIPHVKNRPGDHTLRELIVEHPVLADFHRRNRLLWYNLSTASLANEGAPVVPVKFFSAEAALAALAGAGARIVRSLGVDGGATYSRSFDDLADTTLLANGRASFDRQFESMAATLFRTGVDFAPLDVPSPIRVFVGACEDQALATRVLEYSIRRHSSMSVTVTPLYEVSIPIPQPRDPRNQPRTPFSFQRFLIPEAAGQHGRAIYLDSDMLVFRDIKELWQSPMTGAPLLAAGELTSTGRRPQFSVMLLNCERLGWRIDELVAALDSGELTYESLVYQMVVAPGFRPDIPPRWNSLERFSRDETCLLHYTDMNTQPWLSCLNPRGYLWCRELIMAVDDGAITLADLAIEVSKGHVRPSLVRQIEERIEDPLLLPKAISRLDTDFKPPHSRLRGGQSSALRSFAAKVAAVARVNYERTPLHALSARLRNRMR